MSAMDPLAVQYTAYNQRRLHYSLLFWACLALQFLGILLTLLFSPLQNVLNNSAVFGAIGASSFLMAFISWRLHGLEIHYENCLRDIEEHWLASEIGGIQKAKITGKLSSRKITIFSLVGLAIIFCVMALFGV